MSLLNSLTTDATIADEKDSLGSRVLPSGLYECTVTSAYIETASSGALGLKLSLETANGEQVRQTLWMTSGTAKGKTNYYLDKNGAKQYLPGFLAANALALLTVGQEISALSTEQKVIKAWNAEAKAEVPTKVDMIVDVLGKKILIGLIKQIVDKTAKDGAGVYQPTGETREENEIDKLFRAEDRLTVAEIRGGADTAVFADQWAAKWTGKDKNKAKGAGNGGTAGAPARTSVFAAAASGGAPAAARPTTSLFAKS